MNELPCPSGGMLWSGNRLLYVPPPPPHPGAPSITRRLKLHYTTQTNWIYNNSQYYSTSNNRIILLYIRVDLYTPAVATSQLSWSVSCFDPWVLVLVPGATWLKLAAARDRLALISAVTFTRSRWGGYAAVHTDSTFKNEYIIPKATVPPALKSRLECYLR